MFTQSSSWVEETGGRLVVFKLLDISRPVNRGGHVKAEHRLSYHERKSDSLFMTLVISLEEDWGEKKVD